jgi:hypothetical protein
MDEYKRQTDALKTKMWTTAGARYSAARRLRYRDWLSTFSIALLSVITIAVGLLDPAVKTSPQSHGFTVAVATAIISVFILVISLIEAGRQSAVKAEKLHDSAVRISEVRTSLEAESARAIAENREDWDGLASRRGAYESCIRECPHNHDTIDYDHFQVKRRKSPEFAAPNGKPRIGLLQSTWIGLLYDLSYMWLAVTSWVVVIALLYFTFDWPRLHGLAAATSKLQAPGICSCQPVPDGEVSQKPTNYQSIPTHDRASTASKLFVDAAVRAREGLIYRQR